MRDTVDYSKASSVIHIIEYATTSFKYIRAANQARDCCGMLELWTALLSPWAPVWSNCKGPVQNDRLYEDFSETFCIFDFIYDPIISRREETK